MTKPVIKKQVYDEVTLLAANGREYRYRGLSPYQRRQAEKILKSRHPNKIWAYLKPFSIPKEELDD